MASGPCPEREENQEVELEELMGKMRTNKQKPGQEPFQGRGRDGSAKVIVILGGEACIPSMTTPLQRCRVRELRKRAILDAGLKLVQNGRLEGLAVLGPARDSPQHPAPTAVNGDSIMLLQSTCSIRLCP